MNNFGTINKAVSLFLVGGLFLLLVLSLFWFEFTEPHQRAEIIENLKNMKVGAGAAALATLAFVALSSVFGVGAQGLAGVLIRAPFQRLTSKYPLFVFLFGQRTLGREVNRWREFFQREARLDPVYGPFLEDRKEVAASRHSFPIVASALFYRTAKTAHLDWVLRHYSTYYLATDITLVLIAAFVWVLFQIARIGWSLLFFWILIGLVVLIYSCLCLALHRYLYTSGAWLRHGSLELASRRHGDSEEPDVSSEEAVACEPVISEGSVEGEPL